MELFAAGFNAWNQLFFNSNENRQLDLDDQEEPHDVSSFTKVLSAINIEKPVSRLSYTIVRRDGKLCVAGLCPTAIEEDIEFLYSSAETATGEILAIETPDASGSNVLVKYPSLSAWKASQPPQHSWNCDPPAKQIAAFNTGFAILYSDGSVSTLGDARFEGCLARDISPDQPASIPGRVSDLDGISTSDDPVKHIAAGGASVAVLTHSSSTYVWGHGSSSNTAPSVDDDSSKSTTTARTTMHCRGQAFSMLSGFPNYTEVDGGKDVLDVALGESHALAVTIDGCVYVIGDNSNGQLGLEQTDDGNGRVEDWTKVPFVVADGNEIVAVAAGPRSSFILTSKSETYQG